MSTREFINLATTLSPELPWPRAFHETPLPVDSPEAMAAVFGELPPLPDN